MDRTIEWYQVIRRARYDHDWNHQTLADRLTRRLGRPVAWSALAQWEAGTKRPRPDTLAALVAELELPPTFVDTVPQIPKVTMADLDPELAALLKKNPEVRKALNNPRMILLLTKLMKWEPRPGLLDQVRDFINRRVHQTARRLR